MNNRLLQGAHRGHNMGLNIKFEIYELEYVPTHVRMSFLFLLILLNSVCMLSNWFVVCSC